MFNKLIKWYFLYCFIFLITNNEIVAKIWKKSTPAWDVIENDVKKSNSGLENCDSNEEICEPKKLFSSKRKMYMNPILYPEQEDDIDVSSFRSANPINACNCPQDLRLTDLGAKYFPRYITTAVCLSGSCNTNNVCRPKYYKIRVLRQRRNGDIFQESPFDPMALPLSLQEQWILEAKIITVACECVPKI